jgi:hypothetical protein
MASSCGGIGGCCAKLAAANSSENTASHPHGFNFELQIMIRYQVS